MMANALFSLQEYGMGSLGIATIVFLLKTVDIAMAFVHKGMRVAPLIVMIFVKEKSGNWRNARTNMDICLFSLWCGMSS